MNRLFRKPAPALAMLVLFGLAGAAQAQDRGACGQPLVLTQGSYVIAGADAAPIDSTISVARREPVYVEIEVLSQTGVTIETATQNADPVVILFDETGRPVRGDDDGAGDLNSRLGVDLTPGRYCAQVSTITEIPTGGPAPQGFDTAIPINIRTGIEPGSGGCFSDPGLIHLDQPLSAGFDALEFNAGAPAAYLFTAEEGTTLSIFAGSNTIDTLLTLEDASGLQIATDDDSGGGTNSYIGIDYGLSAGEYCVSVSSYDGSGGAANLTISEYSEDAAGQLGSGAPTDPCGNPATTTVAASALGAGTTSLAMSELLSDSNHDLSFELSEPMSLRLTATSNDLDTIMWLYSADGTLINENDDADGLGTNSRIQSDTVLPAGAYCASVGPYGGSGSGGVSLEILELSEEALLAEAYASGELLPPESSGIELADLGVLQRSLRTDNAGGETRWYLFEVEEESFVVVDSASLDSVSHIALFDYEGTGQRIASSMVDSDNLNTRLVKKVGSGIYALAVVPDTASGGGMAASALSIQRYIRPPRQ